MIVVVRYPIDPITRMAIINTTTLAPLQVIIDGFTAVGYDVVVTDREITASAVVGCKDCRPVV